MLDGVQAASNARVRSVKISCFIDMDCEVLYVIDHIAVVGSAVVVVVAVVAVVEFGEEVAHCIVFGILLAMKDGEVC